MTAILDGRPGILDQNPPLPFTSTVSPYTAGTTDNTLRVFGINILPTTTFRFTKTTDTPASPILTVKALQNYEALDTNTGVPASVEIVFDLPPGDYTLAGYHAIAINGSIEAVVGTRISVNPA